MGRYWPATRPDRPLSVRERRRRRAAIRVAAENARREADRLDYYAAVLRLSRSVLASSAKLQGMAMRLARSWLRGGPRPR